MKQIRAIIDDIEETPSYKMKNGFTHDKLIRNKPISLLEACQLSRGEVDQLISNIDKICTTIITEIKQSHESVGIDIENVPEINALL